MCLNMSTVKVSKYADNFFTEIKVGSAGEAFFINIQVLSTLFGKHCSFPFSYFPLAEFLIHFFMHLGTGF